MNVKGIWVVNKRYILPVRICRLTKEVITAYSLSTQPCPSDLLSRDRYLFSPLPLELSELAVQLVDFSLWTHRDVKWCLRATLNPVMQLLNSYDSAISHEMCVGGDFMFCFGLFPFFVSSSV